MALSVTATIAAFIASLLRYQTTARRGPQPFVHLSPQTRPSASQAHVRMTQAYKSMLALSFAQFETSRSASLYDLFCTSEKLECI